MKFVDWFSGIGGFRLGLERAGHECVWSCELARFPRQVYAERFGRKPQGRDIRDVTSKQIPEADLWVGGFPCQDLSIAGRRRGFSGTRSGLVWTLLDLARERRPEWLLLENVPGMLSVDRGRGFASLLDTLEELGYVGAWRTLNAEHFGVPQRRRRVFLLARRSEASGRGPAQVLFEPESVPRDPRPSRRTREDLAYALMSRAGGSRLSAEDNYVIGSFNSTAESGRGGNGFDEKVSPPVKRGSSTGAAPPAVILNVGRKVETRSGSLASRPGGSRQTQYVASGLTIRRLTPLECERLQGFPDGWTKIIGGASDTDRYAALGNAVAVPVIAWIGRRLT